MPILKQYGYTHAYINRNSTARSVYQDYQIILCGASFFSRVHRPNLIYRLRDDLRIFSKITDPIKVSVIDALIESEDRIPMSIFRYYSEKFEDVIMEEKDALSLFKISLEEIFNDTPRGSEEI